MANDINISLGLIWSEIKQLWDTGAKAYISDMWNVADFVTNSLYLATIALRLRAYYDVSINKKSKDISRFGRSLEQPLECTGFVKKKPVIKEMRDFF